MMSGIGFGGVMFNQRHVKLSRKKQLKLNGTELRVNTGLKFLLDSRSYVLVADELWRSMSRKTNRR